MLVGMIPARILLTDAGLRTPGGRIWLNVGSSPTLDEDEDTCTIDMEDSLDMTKLEVEPEGNSSLDYLLTNRAGSGRPACSID